LCAKRFPYRANKKKHASRTLNAYLYDCKGVTERLAQGVGESEEEHEARVAEEIAAFERALK